MAIQWYPGHMHKAQKEMKQSLPKVDLIIEVLDSRIPFSSENPLIASIRKDKPCIKVLSKSDLADPEVLALWQAFYEQEQNVKTLAITTNNKNRMRVLPELCRKLLPNKKNSGKKMRAMIMGIPNVGKSTLINVLAGKVIAKTGNEPAVTKRQQDISIGDDLVLLDTPGILWPKQLYENSSYRLAATGAIKDTAMEYGDIGFFAAEYLLSAYPQLLMERYNLEELPRDEQAFFELIGRQRGCLVSGGRVDFTKITELFIHDLRSGIIGNVCMETPEIVVKEVQEYEILAAEKEEKKKARLDGFKKKR